MEKLINIKSFLKAGVLLITLGLFVVTSSCEEDTDFNLGATLPSYSDGIQNLDEEGVDCGGNSPKACETCVDGVQNQGEEGIDCGGPCSNFCTPRFDALQGLGLPYFHTFEAAESGNGLAVADNNTVTLEFSVSDPAGSNDIVGKYTRPEGDVAGGFSDFKFASFDAPIDFSEFNKFTLEVYLPSSNAYDSSLVPLVEIIFFDSSNPDFFNTWTVIEASVSEDDFDKWVKLNFDGSASLPGPVDYDAVAIRMGGSNHQIPATFFVRDLIPAKVLTQAGTPRADALSTTGIPYYFTFEASDATSGMNLEPRTTNADGTPYSQGVDVNYGVADPAGSINGVTRMYRPENGPFGGFEDFKFQPQSGTIDFSEYHKFKIDVYIPSSNNFNGALTPTVDVILHDDNNEFFNRWTVITQTVTEADFDTWVTLEFDGTNAAAAGSGTLLPANTTYTVFTLRVGGFGHPEAGEFFVKDFVTFK